MSFALLANRFENVSHLQIGRVFIVALALAPLGLCGAAESVPAAVIHTSAFAVASGFSVLDGTGALPDSIADRPYIWVLIVPTSIAINVIIGTVLVTIGPSLSPCWFWVTNTALVGLVMAVGAVDRRRM